MIRRVCGVLLVLTIAVGLGSNNHVTAAGGAIGINFVGTGTAMGAAESAGVVPMTHWNNATGVTRTTPLALVDETGAPSGATVTWRANNTWRTPIADAAGNARMMRGYLDTSNTSVTTVTVAGLPTAAYDVYLYADGDNGNQARTAAYRISGTGITTTTINLTDVANANFNGTFTRATNSNGNYVKFSIVAGGFTLTATPGASGGNKRAPLNAVQIVPTAPPPPPSPDFSVAVTPSTRSVTQGNATSYGVTVTATNGFAGTVDLSVTGVPANATAAFDPASIAAAGASTLNVATAADTPTGTSTLTIRATSGALTRTATVTVTVTPPPDFTIAASPDSQSIVPSGTATYTITTGALNGFAGSVDLTVNGLPANASAAFTPASIAGSGSATLKVTSAGDTPTGPWPLTIVGTSGPLTHSDGVSLIVNEPGAARAVGIDFTGTGSAMGAAEQAGVIATANWNSASGASRTTPLALIDETGAASGATVTWSSNNGWRVPITDAPGNARMMAGYLDTSDTSVTTVTVAGLANAAYDVYVYADGDNANVAKTAAYRISGAGITTTTVNLTDPIDTNFSGTFTQAAGGSGNYVKFSVVASGFTVTATPGASAGNKRAPINALQIVPAAPPPPPSPDYSIAAAPGSHTVTQGGRATFNVTTAVSNGFTGVIDLSVTGLPANATATFTPASIAGAGTATLDIVTALDTPAGTSTLTIRGSSGSLLRSAVVSLVVTGMTYSVSGVISPAADAAGTTITLGGAATGSTTADPAGVFSFPAVGDGSYLVTPSKSGLEFTPPNRTVAVNGADVTGVDFAAAQSPNTITMSAPAAGATVSNAFSMSATTTGSIVAVQFQVDGADAGPEDTTAPFSVSVTAANGAHTLRAIGRDASGATVTSAPVNITVSGGTGTALAVNGAQTFQTIDGFGVNINSLSWKNGELAPALDRLVDEVGAKTWRVVFDMMDWESTNDNADPHSANWDYYNALYSNTKFQNLWGTLRYLNQKGVTSGIMISFMGRVPAWMGGPKVTNTPAMEDEFVETVATLLYYARNAQNVRFDLLDAINEPDWDGFEGPQVDQWQYPRLLQKLAAKLDAMGLGDVRFIGPNTAQITTGVDTYLPELVANPVVMSRLDHFGFHNYAGQTGGADARIKASAPTKNFWITELSIPEQIFTMIGQGAAAAQIWDAYDSVYNHAIIAGQFYNDGRGTTPPNDAGNLAALMSYSTSTGAYTARPQFYQMQTFKYVMPGSLRIAATESNANLTIYAFRHPTTGRVTIVGRNIGGSSITLNGSLSGVGSISTLQLYQTSIGNNYSSFTRGSDAVVTSGSFIATVAANSYFTLTSPEQ